MSNFKLSGVAKTRLNKRNVDTPISGTGGYLGVGIHDVNISDVDLSGFSSRGYIDFTFKGVTGGEHRQRIWVLQYGTADEYNTNLVKLINALFQDHKIYALLDELIADEEIQEIVFMTFKSMKLRIKLQPSEGYTIECSSGTYYLLDGQTKNKLDTREFNSIADARKVAVAKELKRSWQQIQQYEALADAALTRNIETLQNAVEGLRQAASAFTDTRQIFNPTAFGNSTKGK